MGYLHEVFGEKVRGLSQRGIASFGTACELSGTNRTVSRTAPRTASCSVDRLVVDEQGGGSPAQMELRVGRSRMRGG